MGRIDERNLEHIKAIFRSRTGVEIPGKSRRPLWKGAVRLAAAMGILFAVCSLPVLGYSMFSAIDSESLSGLLSWGWEISYLCGECIRQRAGVSGKSEADALEHGAGSGGGFRKSML